MASVKKTTTKTGEPRYRVRFRDPAGRSREKWFGRKVDADRYARTVEVDIDRGEFVDPRAGKSTFRDVARTWQAARVNKARSTRDRDASHLNSLILPTFGDRRIDSIRTSEIETWLAGLDKSPNTKTKALQILRGVLDVARRDRRITHNPAAEIASPGTKTIRPGKALTDDEAREVIQAAETVDPRTAILVHLMMQCGLRSGEALALRRKDIDFAAGTIPVTTSMTGAPSPCRKMLPSVCTAISTIRT
jgi:integrase